MRLEGAISALTADAAFNDGNYTSPPKKGLAAWSRHWAGWVWSQEWWRRELYKAQGATVEEVLAARTARDAVRDAKNVTLTPIPSLWGHSAGGGSNPADNDFINDQIGRFLAHR